VELKSLTEQKSLLATLPAGKRARLYRLLYEFGPGNGTLMLLPIDQGIEHGPRDFFANPASKNPDYQFSLAAEAGYSALACQIGMADLAQLRHVRQECDRYGMPLVVWSYPRGEAVAAKGGQDSFYAIDYAARMAMEMGADIVKLNMPKINPEKDKDAPAPYNEMQVDQQEAIRQCVESAGRALVVLSGGSRADDETVLRNTREVMEAGGSGVIFGRNVWQREHNEAIDIVEQIKESLLANVRRTP
jgi:DhnA family fructose-bisphosphate aldolase class Ia